MNRDHSPNDFRNPQESKRELELETAESTLEKKMDTPIAPKGTLAIIGGTLALVLKKLGSALVLVKFLKLGKLLTTLSTMFAMAWAYSHRYGWKFSIGIVLLILIHELGHGYAAKRLGIRVGAPIFIPFLGAFIALKDKPKNQFELFLISAGGPVSGTAAGLTCLFISDYFSSSTQSLFLSLGFFTLVMNLFNLMPVGGLDGSGMVSSFHRLEWVLGFPLMIVAAYLGINGNQSINPVAFMVLIVAGLRAAWCIFNGHKTEEAMEETQVNSPRFIAAATYFFLSSLAIYIIHAVWPALPRI